MWWTERRRSNHDSIPKISFLLALFIGAQGKRHAAKLQRGALCSAEEGTGDRDDALVRALHGHPLGSRNAVAEKVVALVRVARANAGYCPE